MDPDLKSHFTDLVAKAQRILIFPRPGTRGDAIAAALGLGLQFETLGKQITVVSAIPDKLAFLARPKQVVGALAPGGEEFVIHLDTSSKSVAELRYEKTETGLDVFIRAKDGRFEPSDVRFPETRSETDLIITVGAPDLDSLGNHFSTNPDLFFSHPIVNIDAGARNELFGELNCVEPDAHSVAETIVELLPPPLSADAATALFASLAIATNNFRSLHLHAETLTRAASLVTAGADRSTVLKHLDAVRPVPRLQLAGRILARATAASAGDLYTSILQPYDLAKTGMTETDLPLAIEELRENFGQLKRLVVLWTDSAGVRALFGASNPTDHETFAVEEGATRLTDELSELTIEGIGLKEAESRLVKRLEGIR